MNVKVVALKITLLKRKSNLKGGILIIWSFIGLQTDKMTLCFHFMFLNRILGHVNVDTLMIVFVDKKP